MVIVEEQDVALSVTVNTNGKFVSVVTVALNVGVSNKVLFKFEAPSPDHAYE